MTEQEFKQCLTLYGTELENWPLELRVDARRASYNSTFRRLIARQKKIDEMLENRRLEPFHPDLADRIIHAARMMRRPAVVPFSVWIRELLAMVLPERPAFAVAAIITLGIVLGFMMPAPASSEGEKGCYYANLP